MGIRVIDAEHPAGYDCTSTQHSKTANLPTCRCMCCGCSSSGSGSSRGCANSSLSSESSTSNTTSNTFTCTCKNANCCIHCHAPANCTLTLTFANNNNNCCSNTNSNHYHDCKTEMLQVPFSNAATQTLTQSTKDLVGNYKEYRIENNKCDLRIIGNGNRIRIGCNQANLQIIGNSTRLKITNNTGNIRYTGNEGRICLGSDSIQQAIDYIGNNGRLKVVKAAELLSEKCKSHKQKIPKEETTATMNTSTTAPMASAACTEKLYATSVQTEKTIYPLTCLTPKKLKVKSASFAGDYSGTKWQQFNELFDSSASMPNLKVFGEHEFNGGADEKSEKTTKKGIGSKNNMNNCCRIDNNINITKIYGNISIKNSVNVSM